MNKILNVKPTEEAIFCSIQDRNIYSKDRYKCTYCNEYYKTVDHHLANKCKKILSHDYTRRYNLKKNVDKWQQKIVEKGFVEIKVYKGIKNIHPNIYMNVNKNNSKALIEIGVTRKYKHKISRERKVKKILSTHTRIIFRL